MNRLLPPSVNLLRWLLSLPNFFFFVLLSHHLLQPRQSTDAHPPAYFLLLPLNSSSTPMTFFIKINDTSSRNSFVARKILASLPLFSFSSTCWFFPVPLVDLPIPECDSIPPMTLLRPWLCIISSHFRLSGSPLQQFSFLKFFNPFLLKLALLPVYGCVSTYCLFHLINKRCKSCPPLCLPLHFHSLLLNSLHP